MSRCNDFAGEISPFQAVWFVICAKIRANQKQNRTASKLTFHIWTLWIGLRHWRGWSQVKTPYYIRRAGQTLCWPEKRPDEYTNRKRLSVKLSPQQGLLRCSMFINWTAGKLISRQSINESNILKSQRNHWLQSSFGALVFKFDYQLNSIKSIA